MVCLTKSAAYQHIFDINIELEDATMKIVIEKNDDVLAFRQCFVCGEQYEIEPVMAVAYTIQGVRMARICHNCVKAGASGIKERAHRHAQKLEKMAEKARRVAESLEYQEIDVPPFDEFQKKLKEVEGQY